MKQRIIKFRAWDILNKRMLNTNISIDFVNNMCHIFDENFKGNSTFITEFIPLEFTGLQAIDGTEIFEGDIIRIFQTNGLEIEYSEVFFKDGEFSYYDWAYGDEYKTNYSLSAVCSEDGINHEGSHFCEIIGNIYENKDLKKILKNRI